MRFLQRFRPGWGWEPRFGCAGTGGGRGGFFLIKFFAGAKSKFENHMSIWKKLFGRQNSTDTEKILQTMTAFTDAAFLMLPANDYEDDESLKKTVFVFLFGALDALILPFHFKNDEKLLILKAYLEQTFQSMTPDERNIVLAFLIDASGNPSWIPVMQRGGQTMVDWGRGEAKAPLTLSHIVHFGIEVSDMMVRDRAKKRPDA